MRQEEVGESPGEQFIDEFLRHIAFEHVVTQVEVGHGREQWREVARELVEAKIEGANED